MNWKFSLKYCRFCSQKNPSYSELDNGINIFAGYYQFHVVVLIMVF